MKPSFIAAIGVFACSGFLTGCFNDDRKPPEEARLEGIESRIRNEIGVNNEFTGAYDGETIDCIAKHMARLEHRFMKEAQRISERKDGSAGEINQEIEGTRGYVIGQGLVIMMSCQQDPRVIPPSIIGP